MSETWLIVGGGIVGLATAYALVQARPQAHVTLLEKESALGQHQSSHNSGVLHAGLYYRPGSLKARLAVQGIRRMTEFCRHHDVAHEICGKLVVACDEQERSRLAELQRRGVDNGLRDLQWLTPAQWQKREPHVQGVAALHVPEEGIVDYPQVITALAAELLQRGVTLATQAKVVRLLRKAGTWVARTQDGREFQAQRLINCSGLHCDRVARLSGSTPSTRIVPFRGEYFALRPESRDLVRHLVYPVPDPAYPFLGVHFTRLIHGGMECGPNAVLALAREGYTWHSVNLRDSWEVATFPGFWRFLGRHKREAWREVRASLSRAEFCRNLQKLVPAVQVSDLEPGGSGVRAQAMTPQGELVSDFEVLHAEGAVHLLNAPSPAATASLAIGEYLVSQLP